MEAVQALEEKVNKLSKRVSVLEMGSSFSEDGHEREWRWEIGSWWFRAPLLKGVRVNVRSWRKISRLVRQMVEQEGERTMMRNGKVGFQRETAVPANEQAAAAVAIL